MAKQIVQIKARDVKVGDLVCDSSSMHPSDRVTRVDYTPRYKPSEHAKVCDVLIICGKQATLHVPGGAMVTTKH